MIDMKAEAEKLATVRMLGPGGECPVVLSGHAADIVALCNRVRDEAISETVEKIERLLMMNSCGCLHAIRQAFAEPGNCSESPNSSPETKEGIDNATML